MSDTGKDYGEFIQERRAKHYEDFVLNTLPRLEASAKVEAITTGNNSFEVTTSNFGVIDIYPKANKIRIRRQNKWIYSITPWLIKHVL